jgi:hypothetical protein
MRVGDPDVLINTAHVVQKKIRRGCHRYRNFSNVGDSGASFPDEAWYFESMQARFVLEATRRSKMTPNDPEQPLLKAYYNQSATDFDLRELVT